MAVEKLDNFKGGEKEMFTKMFSDESTKIMLSVLKSGASIGLHTHQQDEEIIFMIKGKGLIHFDGETEIISEGQAFYCPKGHSHDLVNNTDEEIMFFAVVPHIG